MIGWVEGAVVTATGPVAVRTDSSGDTGTAVAAHWHVAAYTPTVGDRVLVTAYKGGLLILGKEATG